jgi:hypothetical protein
LGVDQDLRDRVDDPSSSWMYDADLCRGGHASSYRLALRKAGSGGRGCAVKQSLQWCSRVGVVSTKVHRVAPKHGRFACRGWSVVAMR